MNKFYSYTVSLILMLMISYCFLEKHMTVLHLYCKSRINMDGEAHGLQSYREQNQELPRLRDS
uniref:Uncharacterized protein n=1 Tax=Nelumbo nucifera TaxID=4432 RepID=A0A822Y4R5_NELNU|nr:TPA_asm: hypothetical protein HUJ06_026062 [Nelumbo nucifera]